jgi:hypothetical protein
MNAFKIKNSDDTQVNNLAAELRAEETSIDKEKMSNIGMMDSAFFVGRKELIDWINDTLEINIQKVEQTASGAIACQLFDIMHPG